MGKENNRNYHRCDTGIMESGNDDVGVSVYITQIQLNHSLLFSLSFLLNPIEMMFNSSLNDIKRKLKSKPSIVTY